MTAAQPALARAGIGRGGTYVATVAALAAAYAAAAVFGLTWAVTPGAGSPIWPASGLALAALILGGVRLWPGVLLGRMAAAILLNSPQPWWADLLLAGASTLGAYVPAWYVRRLPAFDPSLSTLNQILWLIGAALVSAAFSAAPGALILWIAGAPPGVLPAIFVNWALGNACGVLVLTPLLMVWSQRESWRMTPPQALHLVACVAVAGVAAYVVFMRPALPRLPTWYLFPLIVWAALAFSVRGVSLTLAAISVPALWSALTGAGPFGSGVAGLPQRILFAQQFVGITAITMLVLAAVADERRGRSRIADSERRLRAEVAERVRAEERQELLINELNHRVKNTLATVQSIAIQTLRPHLDPGQAKELFTERLIALSRAHDVLTARSWAGAELGEVARRALEPFDDDASHAKASGPTVWLSPKAALAIAMALHELGTNATKYGALSSPAGEVRLTWTLETPEMLRLVWRERNGPRVTAPTGRGFGSRLIERGLKADLGGEARLSFEPDGLVCEITARIDPDPQPAPLFEVRG